VNGTRFRVFGSVNQPTDACVHHGAGAHRTRFNCSKQLAFAEAMVFKRSACLAQRDHLCVRGGIFVQDVAIPTPSHDLAGAHHNRSDRHFAGRRGPSGFAQGFLHPEFVVHSCCFICFRENPLALAMINITSMSVPCSP
jgi:hypothetical protein